MASKVAPSTDLKTLYGLISCFIRGLTLGYAALAVYAFLETRKLMSNSNSFEVDDGSLYVPFVWSLPEKIDIDGAALSTSIQYVSPASNETLEPLTSSQFETAGRERLDSLAIWSNGLNLIFSAFASVIFIFATSCARCNLIPFKGATYSFSTTFFFSLVLVQTGCSTGAMVEQNRFWVNYFQDLVDEMELDLAVESHTNSAILIASALGAFGVAFFVLIDALIFPCCQSGGEKNTLQKDEENEAEVAASDDEMKRQAALAVEDASQSSNLSDDPSSPSFPSWSSVQRS